MKLLVVSQYFWPENFIINDLVKCLVGGGHEVTVLTGKPNYPDGVVYGGYEAGGVHAETFVDKVAVVRVPLRPRGGGGGARLALNYLSFVWNGLVHGWRLVRGHEFDAIVVFAPSPITSALPAVPLKYLKKAHLAVWVQDLWPDSLAATGFVRSRLVLRLTGWVVRSIYGFADTLLIQSQAFEEPVARHAARQKIVYYPNSVLADAGGELSEVALPPDLGRVLEENFCIVFAGNLGKAQAVETLVGAAERLRDLPQCKLVLVGSGSMVGEVRAAKSELGLDNLILAGRHPAQLMPEVFRRAAGLVVTLRSDEIFSYTIPSKVQAYLGAGRPIIAAVDGEGARIVARAGAGLTCPAEDAEALARCVRELWRMPEEQRQRLGDAGRAYFLEHFEMERQARRLVEILKARGTRESR